MKQLALSRQKIDSARLDALDQAYQELEQKINQMIFDLSNDCPELVAQFNAKFQYRKPEIKPSDLDGQRLWRLIASRCHPDKCQERQDLFVQAKRFREEGKWAQLYRIFLLLFNGEDLAALNVENKVEDYTDGLEQRLLQLQASYMGQLFSVYCVDRNHALLLYIDYLQQRIAEQKVAKEDHSAE